VVEIGGPTPEGLAHYLLGLATPLQVLSPDSVRETLIDRTRELLRNVDRNAPS
jgi:predicted DNA-binding transcriptional regulator YafY